MSAFADFAFDFFTALGCEPAWREGRLHVGLGPELAAYYGRDALILTFKPHDAEGELVAFGSRAFEAMLDYMASRGRHAAGRLSASGRPARVIRLVNGQAITEAERPAPRAYYALNFHLTCLSDERAERLATYLLDSEGRLAPELAQWLESGAPLEPVEGVASAVPEAVSRAAEDMAVAEAEQWAEALEAETLGRLRQAANRLITYYEEQMSDIPIRRRKGQSEDEAVGAALDERMQLRRELARKLGEETGRHQVRLQVRRVSQAILEAPGLSRSVRLTSPHAARSVEVWENLHSGACEAPGCERCGAGPGHADDEWAYGLCAADHLVCEACLGRCQACDRDHCHAELAACHVCGGGACGRCQATCGSGHAVCRTHLGSCGCCGQAYCGECLGACPDCGAGDRRARDHAQACRLCEGALCEAHALGCSLCGLAVCAGDRTDCAGCGDVVCRDHMGDCAHCELPYCARCRDGGASCRACGAVGHAAAAPEAWLAALGFVPESERYGAWLGIENERYRYLLGRALLGDLLVVTDQAGQVVLVKEIGLWRKLFGWMD